VHPPAFPGHRTARLRRRADRIPFADQVVRRRLGHASTETTQAYALLADEIADTEIGAFRRKRETRR